MEGDSSIDRIEDIPIHPLIFICLNLSIFLYVVVFPEWTPYSIVCVALPIFLMAVSSTGMTSATFYIIIFLVVIMGLSGIALTFLKLYKYASLILLICGLLTLPLGIFGVMASIMVWQHTTIPRCIICKSNIKIDHSRPGHFYCLRCGAYYGFMGRRKNL